MCLLDAQPPIVFRYKAQTLGIFYAEGVAAKILFFIAYLTIFGGILSLAIVFYRRYIPATALPQGWATRLHVQGTGIPYGIAISAAALMLYPQTPLFQALTT